jgi:2-polyprenyl-6-methoxyphenol hydroxylase-like FAD-dependent oxidoreductase
MQTLPSTRESNPDVAVIGGGLAGSLTAAMLARNGISVAVIDPHPEYPPDFRCEKLDGVQLEILRKTGLIDAVIGASTPDQESWIARLGVLVDKRRGDQRGIYYPTLVNILRAQIAEPAKFLQSKAIEVQTSADSQAIKLSTGETVSTRLIILANGLNVGLRHQLGLTRTILSECHSISIGFDLKPTNGNAFRFPALTYYTERPADRWAHITLFPIGTTMRANFFVYREMKDPWFQEFRSAPEQTLLKLMPGLSRITGDFTVDGRIQIRPVDLYATHGHLQPGLVVVGDSFATSCPAAGTGARKVLTDVERLCNKYIPDWLATPGMSLAKIEAFYNDPEKRACDAFSRDKAFALKSLSIESTIRWTVERWLRFFAHYAIGKVRQFESRPGLSLTRGRSSSAPLGLQDGR